MELDLKLTKFVMSANAALRMANEALAEFSVACVKQDWQAAEDARLRATANMEAYLDGIAAIHKMMPGG